jgi:hypothetical protein
VSVGFNLNNQFNKCPPYWQNFVSATNGMGNDGEHLVDEALERDFGGRIEIRDGPVVMRYYGWRYLPVKSKRMVVAFNDMKSLFYFMMAWA